MSTKHASSDTQSRNLMNTFSKFFTVKKGPILPETIVLWEKLGERVLLHFSYCEKNSPKQRKSNPSFSNFKTVFGGVTTKMKQKNPSFSQTKL